MVNRYDIKVQVLGRLELLPEDVQLSARNIMKLTNDRKSLLLNICLAYTSKEEILHAVEKMKASNDEITVCDLSRNMYGGGMPDPDILIRTSGETRLSDFLTWQVRIIIIIIFFFSLHVVTIACSD